MYIYRVTMFVSLGTLHHFFIFRSAEDPALLKSLARLALRHDLGTMTNWVPWGIATSLQGGMQGQSSDLAIPWWFP